MSLFINEKVLWFKVSIDNAFAMHMAKCQQYFTDIKHSYIVTEAAIFSEAIEQFSAWAVLKNHVDKTIILKGCFERIDERMIQLHKKILLKFDVLNLLEINDVAFGELLESENFFIWSNNLFNSSKSSSS